MSWLYSQALVAEFSGGISSDGERCAQLNVISTPQPFWHRDKMTEFSRLSQYGLTWRALTGSRGEELLMSFLAGFPARTSAPPEREKGSTDPAAVCGDTWRELWVRYARDSCSWKTHRCLWEEDLRWCSVTLPRWGMMRGGVCWERDISGLGIFEKDSGWWLPTICKNESKGTARNRYIGSSECRGAKMSEGLRTCKTDPIYLNPSFGEIAMGFPPMWTELQPLETDKFQQWQQQHGVS